MAFGYHLRSPGKHDMNGFRHVLDMLQDGLGPAKGWSGDRLGNGLAASAD